MWSTYRPFVKHESYKKNKKKNIFLRHLFRFVGIIYLYDNKGPDLYSLNMYKIQYSYFLKKLQIFCLYSLNMQIYIKKFSISF